MLFLNRAHAEHYTLQLETTQATPTEYYELLSIYGDIYTVTNDDGLILTHLGPYENKTTALEALHELHIAGHTNAFMTQHQNDSPESTSSNIKEHIYTVKDFDVTTLLDKNTLKKWNTLTVVQQSNIRYRDGILQIKDDNKFIPLDEIIKQNQQNNVDTIQQ